MASQPSQGCYSGDVQLWGGWRSVLKGFFVDDLRIFLVLNGWRNRGIQSTVFRLFGMMQGIDHHQKNTRTQIRTQRAKEKSMGSTFTVDAIATWKVELACASHLRLQGVLGPRHHRVRKRRPVSSDHFKLILSFMFCLQHWQYQWCQPSHVEPLDVRC